MKSTLACLFALSLSASAFAAPASNASVERLLVVTKTESVLEATEANVDRVMRQSMLQARGDKPMTPEDQRFIDSTVAKVTAVMHEELTWAKLRPQYVKLYVETFDQSEIDGLLAFYATPAGHAMIDKMPIVLQKSLAITQAQMQTLMPKMMAILQQSMTEAKQGK
jgi:uncharacterized protein